MPRRCGPNCSKSSSLTPRAATCVASVMLNVLLDVPAATGFAFAGGALFLLLGALAPMQMLLSLLVALCCPRLLIAIAKVAVAAAAHLLLAQLAVLLWLPSCSAGTVSGDRPFAEELPPSSASLPPLPPLPSLKCVSMLAAAAVAAVATAVAINSLIATHRSRRRRSQQIGSRAGAAADAQVRNAPLEPAALRAACCEDRAR